MKGPIYETEFVLNDKLTKDHPRATLDETVMRTFNKNEMIEMMNKFHRDIYDKAMKFESENVKVSVISESLFLQIKVEAAHSDMKMAIAIALIVWFYLCYHTKSVFLGTCAVV